MKNKIVFSLSMVLLLSFPLSSEARGGWNGIISQIKDPKAMEAYAKEIKQLTELYEQGKKMQTQIEQLQQSLEHYNFTDLQQTYNFLTDTVDSAERIQKEYVGMNVTASEMRDNWAELNENYDAKTMTPKELEELKKKQDKRREDSAKYRAQLLASIDDTEKSRKQLEMVRRDLQLMDQGKASPIKAIQAVGQLLSYNATEILKARQLAAEEIRNKQEEANRKAQEEKIKQKENENKAAMAEDMVKSMNNKNYKTKFKGPFMTAEDYAEATASSK